jgi:formylmethanofuran dehydrogenase subunit E
MDYKQTRKLLQDFDVKTDEELKIKINETWYKSNCSVCNEEVDLRNCHYENGDPICESCVIKIKKENKWIYLLYF